MRRACRASVPPRPYASNLDRSDPTWEEAMKTAREYTSETGLRYAVRRRRPYDPEPIFGPWIIQAIPSGGGV